MAFYRARGDDRAWRTWVLPRGQRLDRLSAGGARRLRGRWTTPVLLDDGCLPGDLADELPASDIGHLAGGGLVLSPRAVEVLGPMLRHAGELLPCRSAAGRRWVFHCRGAVQPDALRPGAFLADGLAIFRVRGRHGLFVSEIFLRGARAAGLTGLDAVAVPLRAPGAAAAA